MGSLVDKKDQCSFCFYRTRKKCTLTNRWGMRVRGICLGTNFERASSFAAFKYFLINLWKMQL